MSQNIFFKQKGPFFLNELFLNTQLKKKIKIFDVKNIQQATSKDLTFLDHINYINFAETTKALYCLTTEKLKNYLLRSDPHTHPRLHMMQRTLRLPIQLT